MPLPASHFMGDAELRLAYCYHGSVPLRRISGAAVYQSIQPPRTIALRNNLWVHCNRYESVDVILVYSYARTHSS